MNTSRAPIVAQKPQPMPQHQTPAARDLTPPETARHVLAPVEPEKPPE